MLLTKEVKVRWNPKNKKRLESLGYKFTKFNDYILVSIFDMAPNSKVTIRVKCDYCGEIIEKKIQDFLKEREIIKKDCCKKCASLKRKESLQITYGVENIWDIDGYREKLEKTNLNKYGAKYHLSTNQSKEKIKDSLIEKYGVDSYSKTKEYKEKFEKTSYEKFGTRRPTQSNIIKNKVKHTLLDKYGVDNPMKVPEFKEKLINSLYENNTAPCSKQQKYINNLIEGALNYPVGNCLLDIAFPEDKIYIEYDGSGHDLTVKIGTETMEEFQNRSMRRYYFLRNKGWKNIRIISNNDKLPNDEIIKNILKEAFLFLKYSDNNWITIDFDKSMIYTKTLEKQIHLGKLKKLNQEVV